MAISKISDETKARIRDNSVAVLPVNASESGISGTDLQEKFIAPILDDENSIAAVIDTLADEANAADAALDAKITEETNRALMAEQTLQNQFYTKQTFVTDSWTAVNHFYGGYVLSIEPPAGKRILFCFDDKGPRGVIQGNTVYANRMFNGFVLIG